MRIKKYCTTKEPHLAMHFEEQFHPRYDARKFKQQTSVKTGYTSFPQHRPTIPRTFICTVSSNGTTRAREYDREKLENTFRINLPRNETRDTVT